MAALNAKAGNHEFRHNLGLSHDGTSGGLAYYQRYRLKEDIRTVIRAPDKMTRPGIENTYHEVGTNDGPGL